MNASKLKWNKARLLAYLGVAFLVTLIAEDQLYNTHYSLWVWGLVFIIWGIARTMRTKIAFYAVFGIMCGLAAWHYILAAYWHTVLSMPTFLIHLIVNAALLIFWGFRIFSKQERLEQNARRLFELAAAGVTATSDGFTGRPFAAGKSDSDIDEIRNFGRYLDALDIVKTVFDDAATRLNFSMTTSPLADSSGENVSYVSFDRRGGLMVNVSRTDYQQFKDQLTFNQLCGAMADLFKRYLQYYCEGKESRINVEMNIKLQ